MQKVIPRIVQLKEKNLVGCRLQMSIAVNKTAQLWGQFGPRIKELNNRVNDAKISLQIYDSAYFESFSPHNAFEKWALVEVTDFDAIPAGLETLILKEGLYAVFDYIGSSADQSIYQYIFWEWLPNSEYQIADRPHFEVLGEKYRNNDPNSEEEIWIPIKEK